MSGQARQMLRRGTALAVLAVLLLLFGTLVVSPIAGAWADWRAEMSRTREYLARYERLASHRAAFEARLASVRKAWANQTGMIGGENPSVASAKLLADLKRTIEGTGGELRSAQTAPATSEGGFQRVGLRLDIAVDPSRLERLLYAMESGPIELFVDNLHVQAPEAADRSRASMAKLTLRLDVNAFLRPGPE